MSWLKGHAPMIWPAAVLAALGLVVLIRLGSGWTDGTPASAGGDRGGVVTAAPDSLATARRIRLLEDEAGRTREQLASVQTETSIQQERVTVLDEMLASDSLTDCPGFLKDETTVRALQKIIREASDTSRPSEDNPSRLNTAATVARERLRQKLNGLRDQLNQELGKLESQAGVLRQQLRAQTEALDVLQRQIRRQGQSRAVQHSTGPA
jgi:chromosome segregation ATPase